MARIPLYKAPDWVQWVGKEMRAAAERGLLAAAVRTVSHIQNEVLPKENPQPVDRGIFKAAWRASRIPKGAMVSNTSPQAPFIEYGVRSENVKIGRAMIDALAEWVVRKGIGAREESRSIAWAIAKSMQQHGIFNGGTGLRILEKAGTKIPEFIKEEIQREMSRIDKK